jgi:hypothetical protein
MEIIADKPIEVTEMQYRVLMNECAGIVAGRKAEGKFYIKVWMMKYAPGIKSFLEKAQ